MTTITRTTLDTLEALRGDGGGGNCEQVAAVAGYARTAVRSHLMILKALQWAACTWGGPHGRTWHATVAGKGVDVRAALPKGGIPLRSAKLLASCSRGTPLLCKHFALDEHPLYQRAIAMGMTALGWLEDHGDDYYSATRAGQHAGWMLKHYYSTEPMPLPAYALDVLVFLQTHQVDKLSLLRMSSRWPDIDGCVKALASWGLVGIQGDHVDIYGMGVAIINTQHDQSMYNV